MDSEPKSVLYMRKCYFPKSNLQKVESYKLLFVHANNIGLCIELIPYIGRTVDRKHGTLHFEIERTLSVIFAK